jgi:quercetin dioxygenase-like cupin family protein
MNADELFAGFRVAAGQDRFGEETRLGGEPIDCKLSARDTNGATCVFEFRGSNSGPRHRHVVQDEWVYVLDGEFEFQVGEDRFHAGPGESVFIPRGTPHVWGAADGKAGRVINTYQPAGTMEEFFREVGRYDRDGLPPIHEALLLGEMKRLFAEHGMELVGPAPEGWRVEEDGRIVRLE